MRDRNAPVHPLAALVEGLMTALDSELHPDDHHDIEKLRRRKKAVRADQHPRFSTATS